MEFGKRMFDENLEDYNWNDNKGNSIEKNELNNYFENKVQNRINEAITKYMPIGSVVKLKNKLGLYMIVGHKYKFNETEFDYLSIKYPEGITINTKFDMFNHQEIEKIHHIGMVNDIQREYKKSLLGDNEGFNKTL